MSEPKSWTPEKLANHIKELCGNIVAEKLEPLQRNVAEYGAWINGAKSNGGRVQMATVDEQKGLLAGAMIGALALGRGDRDAAIKQMGQKKGNEAVIKALEASTVEGGGVLIPEEVSSEFIDLLTPKAVVRSFGTTVMPMSSGGMIIPKLTAASTAYYIGENADMVKSQQSFGARKLTARKLAVLVPMSNDLLRRGGPRVAQVVRNDMVRSASLKEDITFIRSPGTEFTPKGLKYQMAAANVVPATGGSYDLDSVTADLANLILKLEESNVAFSNPGWMFSPRTAMYLMTVRDGLGQYAFRAEMMTGKFWGWPYKKTTQIPRNLGAGGDESEVYLADFDDVIIGDTMKLEAAVSLEAAYKDENGDLVSAFSLDQTVMRLIMEHDLILRYDESAAMLSGVKWAPGGGA